jgi:hypothetical protein
VGVSDDSSVSNVSSVSSLSSNGGCVALVHNVRTTLLHCYLILPDLFTTTLLHLLNYSTSYSIRLRPSLLLHLHFYALVVDTPLLAPI